MLSRWPRESQGRLRIRSLAHKRQRELRWGCSRNVHGKILGQPRSCFVIIPNPQSEVECAVGHRRSGQRAGERIQREAGRQSTRDVVPVVKHDAAAGVEGIRKRNTRGGGWKRVAGKSEWCERGRTAQDVADLLCAQQVELGDQPAFARNVSIIFIAERTLAALRINGAVEMIGGINWHRCAVVVRDGGIGEAAGIFCRVESGMRNVKGECVADFVMRDRIKIIRFAAEVTGDKPVIIVGQQQPAERVVVSKNFRLESAGAFHRQRRATAGLHCAVEISLAARTMKSVGRSVRIKEIAGVGVGVAEVIAAVEIVRPDVSALGADVHPVQIHSREEIGPVIRRLLGQCSPCGVCEKPGGIPLEIHRHRKIIGALKVLVEDVKRHSVRLPDAVRAGEDERQSIILIEAVAVGKNRETDWDADGRIGDRNRFARAIGAHTAGSIKVKARPVRRNYGRAWKRSIRRSEDVKLEQRIGHVTVPINQRDAALIQRAPEDILDTRLRYSLEMDGSKKEKRNWNQAEFHDSKEIKNHNASKQGNCFCAGVLEDAEWQSKNAVRHASERF